MTNPRLNALGFRLLLTALALTGIAHADAKTYELQCDAGPYPVPDDNVTAIHLRARLTARPPVDANEFVCNEAVTAPAWQAREVITVSEILEFTLQTDGHPPMALAFLSQSSFGSCRLYPDRESPGLIESTSQKTLCLEGQICGPSGPYIQRKTPENPNPGLEQITDLSFYLYYVTPESGGTEFINDGMWYTSNLMMGYLSPNDYHHVDYPITHCELQEVAP